MIHRSRLMPAAAQALSSCGPTRCARRRSARASGRGGAGGAPRRWWPGVIRVSAITGVRCVRPRRPTRGAPGQARSSPSPGWRHQMADRASAELSSHRSAARSCIGLAQPPAALAPPSTRKGGRREIWKARDPPVPDQEKENGAVRSLSMRSSAPTSSSRPNWENRPCPVRLDGERHHGGGLHAAACPACAPAESRRVGGEQIRLAVHPQVHAGADPVGGGQVLDAAPAPESCPIAERKASTRSSTGSPVVSSSSIATPGSEPGRRRRGGPDRRARDPAEHRRAGPPEERPGRCDGPFAVQRGARGVHVRTIGERAAVPGFRYGCVDN